VAHASLPLADLARATGPGAYLTPHNLWPVPYPSDLPALGHALLGTGAGEAKGTISGPNTAPLGSFPPPSHRRSLAHLLPQWVHEDVLRANELLRAVRAVPAARKEGPQGLPVPHKGQQSGTEAQTKALAAPMACCLDRGECQSRDHWLPWKLRGGKLASSAALPPPPRPSPHESEQRVESSDLALVRLHGSFLLIAGDADAVNLLFRTCRPRLRPGPCQ